MRRRGQVLLVLGFCALGVWGGAPAEGAGFGIFEQGTKAMGMAGAFTAQADDPSLLFHNAGGLAFVEKREFAGGVTYIKGAKAEFRGAAPFPGPDDRAEQELLAEVVPHAYWVQPVSNTFKFGFGIEAPFGLTTEWKDPDSFSGRFLSTKAALRAVDLNPTVAWRFGNFGVGIGAIARVSDVELNRHVGAVNPFTQTVADVGRLKLEGDFSEGYGFNVGLLHKWNNSFSWGLSYRSQITVDYEGDARLTQIATGNPQFDAVVASRLPFGRDLPVETSIDFPDMASLGLAFSLSPNLLLETDANWTGWSSFDEVVIDFTNNDLPQSTIPQNWEDVYNYRAGLRWTASPSSEWRVGYVYDESPQQEEGVSPLLPDNDRNGFTLGYGHVGNWKADFAVMYLSFGERSRSKSFPGESDFFGTYDTTAWLFGATLRY